MLAYEVGADGRLVYRRDFGDTTDAADVIAAEISADNLLNLRVFFPKLKQTREYGLKMEPDGSIRAFYNRDRKGNYSIRNGRFAPTACRRRRTSSANRKPPPGCRLREPRSLGLEPDPEECETVFACDQRLRAFARRSCANARSKVSRTGVLPDSLRHAARGVRHRDLGFRDCRERVHDLALQGETVHGRRWHRNVTSTVPAKRRLTARPRRGVWLALRTENIAWMRTHGDGHRDVIKVISFDQNLDGLDRVQGVPGSVLKVVVHEMDHGRSAVDLRCPAGDYRETSYATM